MFSLKNTIFEKYFGTIFHTTDPNKDGQGKGTLQRFIETLAEEWDEEVLDSLKNMLDDTMVPATVKDKFIPYLEKLIGITAVSNDLAVRRKILGRAMEIFRVKGTIRSYWLLFRAMGFTNVQVTKANVDTGFDSSITFDHPVRRFDFGKCHKCQYYILELEGDMDMTEELYQNILAAVAMIEPIYAQLIGITLNGEPVNSLIVYVADNGDLVYTSNNPAQVSLTLQDNGDLIVLGADEALYVLDTNGNLIYNG